MECKHGQAALNCYKTGYERVLTTIMDFCTKVRREKLGRFDVGGWLFNGGSVSVGCFRIGGL